MGQNPRQSSEGPRRAQRGFPFMYVLISFGGGIVSQQLDIVTEGLAPGMWAVVSKVISWEWLENSGRVRWQVETVLPPHVVKGAIPSIVSIELARPEGTSDSASRRPARRRATRKQPVSDVVSAAA